MKVLADYHHGNLYHSLHLLFEKRLGHELYRPIGRDWFTSGYFKVAQPYGNAEDTINQYLGIDQRHYDAFVFLNGDYKLNDDIYHIYDWENKFQHKAITFQKFKEMEFDLIIASHPLHTNWEELLQFQPKAKFIMQLGNEGQDSDAQNILCSTNYQAKEAQNMIRYHQEFDLSDYSYAPPFQHTSIKSFVVSLPEPEIYFAYKNALSEFDFKAHGAGSPDGTVHGPLIPHLMKQSAFGYHNKPGGEGYGHVIHKWYASGRPCIINYEIYKNSFAGPLLIPDKTCISLDQPFDEVIKKIRYFSQPKQHEQMCKDAYEQFEKVVNFNGEADKIKLWLQTL